MGSSRLVPVPDAFNMTFSDIRIYQATDACSYRNVVCFVHVRIFVLRKKTFIFIFLSDTLPGKACLFSSAQA